MAKKIQKISRQELSSKLRNIDIPNEELAKYLLLNDSSGDALRPELIVNPDLVRDNEGHEGAFILNSFNQITRWRRNRKYR